MAYPPPPYADSVCGTFVAGEALSGSWWAYPGEPLLELLAYPVSVIVQSGDVVPPAELVLEASPVTRRIGYAHVGAQAAVELVTSPVALIIDSTIVCGEP